VHGQGIQDHCLLNIDNASSAKVNKCHGLMQRVATEIWVAINSGGANTKLTHASYRYPAPERIVKRDKQNLSVRQLSRIDGSAL
jgi:hypothetical protein